MKRVYFDHSATTPLDKKVRLAMEPYWAEVFGNASSIHSFGQEALAGVDKARLQLAGFLNCSHNDIVFTSGATEADNLAIKGLARAMMERGIKKPHIIISAVEHDAVLEPCRELKALGAQVDHLPVDKRGVARVSLLKSLIKENTVLVSVMWVNSEVGALMPIKEIGKIISRENDKREKRWREARVKDRGKRPWPVYFHSDATQALNFYQCDVRAHKIDLLSLSGHKIYGPKGVGALYVRAGVPVRPEQSGGHHEGGRRSGTLNVSGIVGLGAAVAQLSPARQALNNEKIRAVRDYLLERVMKEIPDLRLNTDTAASTPAHAHFSFFGCEGESILISLDLAGIAVSTGSACASNSLQASHVILAMGIPTEESHASIRFSLGKQSTRADVDRLMRILTPTVSRLRKMNPIYT